MRITKDLKNYNVENGNFLLEKRANKAQMKAIEAAGVTLYENFYTEEALTNESTMRIFKKPTESEYGLPDERRIADTGR